MSLLDCEEIIGLEDPKGIVALMRSWAAGGDYWAQKTKTIYETASNRYFLMELVIKYYQYTQEECEWMEKNDIQYMPIEMCPYLNFNPYVPDDMIIPFLTEEKSNETEEKASIKPYLVCKDDVMIVQLTDKVQLVKYKDIKPEKIQGFYREIY